MLPRPPDADVAPVKAVHKGKFPVVGFVKDPSGVAALYLGKQEGKDLVYMGKVGTGWSRTVSSQIRKQLDTVVSPKSKLTRPIRKPKATWVEPKFYADVEYRDITSEGLLRASSFKGLIKGTGAHLTSPFLCPLLSVKPT
jgi:bifunctional non-homologous end joining protein LigD